MLTIKKGKISSKYRIHFFSIIEAKMKYAIKYKSNCKENDINIINQCL